MGAPISPRETPGALDAVKRQFIIDAASPSRLASGVTGRRLGFLDGGFRLSDGRSDEVAL